MIVGSSNGVGNTVYASDYVGRYGMNNIGADANAAGLGLLFLRDREAYQ